MLLPWPVQPLEALEIVVEAEPDAVVDGISGVGEVDSSRTGLDVRHQDSCLAPFPEVNGINGA